MTVKKQGGKWAVKHCHGKKKGQTIATHSTKAEALEQHKAIQANKKKKKR